MIPAISATLGPLNPSDWSVGGLAATDPTAAAGAIDPSAAAGATDPSAAAGSTSFSSALSSAIDSLQQTQATSDSAAKALATGQATDPTQAVTAVENASLAMDLASQIRTKLTDATNTIFQTQV